MPTMDFEKAVAQTLTNIDSSLDIHSSNKQLIHDYHREMVLSDISLARQQKFISHCKILAEQIGSTPFQDLCKDDIRELVAWLYTRGTTESTISDYKQVMKQLWKWMNGGEDPEETKWIRRSSTPYTKLLPRSLLSPQDVQRLIAECENDRDRAFIAMLWETGARIGELIDLQVGDIEESVVGKHVTVSGKTGSRRLLLLESGPFLDAWLAVHPNPRVDAPLWCRVDLKQGSPNEQISYQYIRLRILARARDQTRIEKPVNPHHFRHSRATYLANYLTEAQLCEWFGWSRSSRVPGRYVHLSGRDIDRAYATMRDENGYESISTAA